MHSFDNRSHYLRIDPAFERIFKPIGRLHNVDVCKFSKNTRWRNEEALEQEQKTTKQS